jgi:hypothetical protein
MEPPGLSGRFHVAPASPAAAVLARSKAITGTRPRRRQPSWRAPGPSPAPAPASPAPAVLAALHGPESPSLLRPGPSPAPAPASPAAAVLARPRATPGPWQACMALSARYPVYPASTPTPAPIICAGQRLDTPYTRPAPPRRHPSFALVRGSIPRIPRRHPRRYPSFPQVRGSIPRIPRWERTSYRDFRAGARQHPGNTCFRRSEAR